MSIAECEVKFGQLGRIDSQFDTGGHGRDRKGVLYFLEGFLSQGREQGKTLSIKAAFPRFLLLLRR